MSKFQAALVLVALAVVSLLMGNLASSTGHFFISGVFFGLGLLSLGFVTVITLKDMQ